MSRGVSPALLGACLSPTDHVLVSDVVSGGPAERDLPEQSRQALTEESGANDGLALPLVLLALAPAVSHAVGRRGAGSAVPGERGGRPRRGGRSSDRRGAARRRGAPGRGTSVGAGADAGANRYLVVPFFLLVRVVLPWKEWGELGGSVLLFALRPPAAPAARGDGPRPAARLRVRNAVFVGWFGPIGVSAVFYLAFSADERAKDPRWLPAGMAVVAVSAVLHGVTAIPGRTLYARSRSPASPSLCPDARDNGRMWRMTTIDGVRSGQACERVRP